MKKRAIREPSCQPQVTVQLPLPVLSRLRAVREGFFELCLRVGEQALDALMEQDRTELCGPKWARQPSRQAGRGGSTASEITLGGRRIRVRRLRAAAVDGRELALPSFLWAAERDPLDAQTWRAIVAGVSTRKYGATLEPVPDTFTARSTSRSAVSRRFVALSQQQLTRCLSRPLSDLDLRVVMIDGIDYHDHTILIALGIDGQGRKHVLGVREGTTENSAVAGALLSDLVDRGLNAQGPLLFVIDGAKALRTAIRRVFGTLGVVHRCQVHKLRNVLEHLPEELRPSVRHAMRQAYDPATSAASAQRQLERLAASLAPDHPGAAASLREGLEETLTLQTLGISGALWKTLRSTNPIENLNGGVAAFTRNVRRWRNGAMILRWVGSAILEAEQQFRRVRGFREMPALSDALHQLVPTSAAKEGRHVALIGWGCRGAVRSHQLQQRTGHPQLRQGLCIEVVVEEVDLALSADEPAAVSPVRQFGDEVGRRRELDVQLEFLLERRYETEEMIGVGAQGEVDVDGGRSPADQQCGCAPCEVDTAIGLGTLAQEPHEVAHSMCVG